MTKGTLYQSESQTLIDARSGASIRQVTSAPFIHHHPFFLIPAYDDAMRWLVFVSHRSGSPQLFVEVRETSQLLQLTDRPDLAEWSIHPSPDGQYVYFTAGTGGWRVHIETQVEEQLIDFGDVAMRERRSSIKLDKYKEGTVGAAMGTTALSRCGRWWAVKFNDGDEACLTIADTQTGHAQIILRRETVAHMQFCPDDANLLFYAGPLTDRVWVIHRDGSGNRRLYRRAPGEWITHESWIPGRRELALVDWPKGVRCIHVDSGEERRVTSVNAWHAICNRTGTQMVADTNFPDIGLQLFDPLDGVGEPATLCYPQASSMGEHWNGPFPYEHGPIQVYAPQHTHPHPSFSPDGRTIIYTSDSSGKAQLYELDLAGMVGRD